jgi:hypothetical protein
VADRVDVLLTVAVLCHSNPLLPPKDLNHTVRDNCGLSDGGMAQERSRRLRGLGADTSGEREGPRLTGTAARVRRHP